MSEKRYFKIEYDEEWYLFDSTTISEQLVKEQAEYGYGVFANSLSPSEVVDLLNEQQATNDYLEESNSRLQIQLGETLRLVDEQQATIRKLQDLCGESDSENAKLRIENEQLRKELYNFKPVMFQDMQKGTVILYFKGDSDE